MPDMGELRPVATGIWKVTFPQSSPKTFPDVLVQSNTPHGAIELALAGAALFEAGFVVDVEFVGWLNFWETGEK